MQANRLASLAATSELSGPHCFQGLLQTLFLEGRFTPEKGNKKSPMDFCLQSCLSLGFLVSTYIFRSWMVLFNFITCLVVFSCNSLRDFCFSSLRTSTCLAVFSCNSLRDFCVSSLRASTCLAMFYCISLSELLMPFLKSSTTIMRYNFESVPYFSGVLWYPGLAVVGVMGSDDIQCSWFLLVRFLHLPFTIW